MRRYIGYLGLALALLVPAAAKTQVFDQRSYPLAVAWDMDGEAADVDQVVVASSVIDSASYTVAANPDTCRLVDITLTDADTSISAGTLTVTGTDCYGDPLTATFTFSTGVTGQQDLTVGTVSTANSANLASAAYFNTVTTVAWGTVTGEDSDDLVSVGYTTGHALDQFPTYGHLEYTRGSAPFRFVNPDWKASPLGRLSTITASGTTWTATNAGFTGLAANDLVKVNINGNISVTRVVTYTSATSIVVADTILFPSAGIQGFEYKKFLLSSDPQDGWMNVQGWDTLFYVFDVDAVAASTGITSDVSCTPFGVTGDFDDAAVQVDADQVLTGATGNAVTSIDLRLAPYSFCRFGVAFDGLGADDADSADEDINAYMGLRR